MAERERRKSLSVTLNAELVRYIRSKAKREDRTISDVLEELAQKGKESEN